MPLYEYQCKQCGHRFERILKSFSAEDVKECPVCQGPVERLLSAPAVQFKGSGFYSTDYGAKQPASKSHSAGETGGASTPASGPASGSTPTKTEGASSSGSSQAASTSGSKSDAS